MKKTCKKMIAAALALLILLTLPAGCDPPNGYTGTHNDLYTLAVNNIIGAGVDSRGYQTLGSFSEQIDIIESDSYGRTLFTYWCRQSGMYFGNELHAMCICQKSGREEVYYYEDDCFFLYTDYDKIPQEKIDELKKRNDWEQPYNDHAMIQTNILKDRSLYGNASALDKPAYKEKELYVEAAFDAVYPNLKKRTPILHSYAGCGRQCTGGAAGGIS